MRKIARAVLVVITIGICISVGYFFGLSAHREAPSGQSSSLQDNEELRQLYVDDQADRSPADARAIDWSVVGARDRARQSRVKALFSQGGLQTADDYYHAAMILQHGDAPEDFLLAHEFCVVAIIKGKNDHETRWLVASAEDRFLTRIGRPQRFATQFGVEGDGLWTLSPVDTSITDELRRLMGAHSLEEARKHEAELNQKR